MSRRARRWAALALTALTLVLLGICAVWSVHASTTDGALLTIGIVLLDGVLVMLAFWLGSSSGDNHEALP